MNNNDEQKNIVSNKQSDMYEKMVRLSNGGYFIASIYIEEDNIRIEHNGEIMFIPYSAIRDVILDHSNIKLFANGTHDMVIEAKGDSEKVYTLINTRKEDIFYDNNSSVIIEDVFGNNLSKTVSNKSKFKIVIFIAICIVIILFIKSCSNFFNQDFADLQIEKDIKSGSYILGYGTTYVIGEVESVSCESIEEDAQGRQIIKCNIIYFPKKNNGSIALDSKLNETVYAIYLQGDNDNYYRYYTNIINDKFKENHCWSKDKSKKLSCFTINENNNNVSTNNNSNNSMNSGVVNNFNNESSSNNNSTVDDNQQSVNNNSTNTENKKTFKASLEVNDGFNNYATDAYLKTISGECIECEYTVYLNGKKVIENQSYTDENYFNILGYKVGTNTLKVEIQKNGSKVLSVTTTFEFDYDKIPTPTFTISKEYNTYQDKKNISIWENANGCDNCGMFLYINGVQRKNLGDTQVSLNIGENEFKIELANKFGKKSCKRLYITRFEYNPDVDFTELGQFRIEEC